MGRRGHCILRLLEVTVHLNSTQEDGNMGNSRHAV